MMQDLLIRCQNNLSTLPCCHNDGRICNCYYCLQSGFYNACMPDDYDCPKKMNYYVLNYGPSYSSEFYYYLLRSNILSQYYPGTTLNVLSIGCGFAPDLLAMEQFIRDNNLTLSIYYDGIDISNNWQSARFFTNNCRFYIHDVHQGFTLRNYHIVIMGKVFSTIYRNYNGGHVFLQLLNNLISTELNTGSYLIFNDINSIHMGRDVFHCNVYRQFSNIRQFFFRDRQDWMGQNWIQIPDINLAYQIPVGLTINPLNECGKTVFFEYRK